MPAKAIHAVRKEWFATQEEVIFTRSQFVHGQM